jgi:hypothetical protein
MKKVELATTGRRSPQASPRTRCSLLLLQHDAAAGTAAERRQRSNGKKGSSMVITENEACLLYQLTCVTQNMMIITIRRTR